MNTVLSHDHKFIGHLERLVKEEDRGALAALRRGLGKPPGTAREMDRHVLPYLPPDSGLPPGAKVKQEDAYYLVSALFAFWHQGKDSLAVNPPENLGESLRALVDREAAEGGNRDEAEKRIEKRLTALLNCHHDDLPDHLRHTIGLLKSKEIPVNWPHLLRDIQGWHWEIRSVQRDWARQFWRVAPGRESADADDQPINEEKEKEIQP